jgi:hypothetical protein
MALLVKRKPAWEAGLLSRAEGEGFEPSSDPKARNGFRDRRNVGRYAANRDHEERDRRSPGASCKESQPAERRRDELKPIFTRAVTLVC